MESFNSQKCRCAEINEGQLHQRVGMLETQMRLVIDRNSRVEINKAWETSKTRQISVSVATYFMMFFLFLVLGSTYPAVGACVPTAGFILSTLSLSFVRRFWETLVRSRLETVVR